MAALSMRDRRDVSNFIRTFTGRHAYIIDYLMEKVLQRQPPEMQTFLLCTAGLEIDFRLGVIESLTYPDATWGELIHAL